MEEFLTSFTTNLFNTKDFLELFSRFIINAVFAYILIDRIYYKINRQREYLFTFFIFNLLIFFVSSLLSDIKMKTGFAFGLFAIFSILRYRTEQINIKEMTFLFICIILAVINSTVTVKIPLFNILFVNGMVTAIVYVLELKWLKYFNNSVQVIYENIELIQADRKSELLADLRKRTGLDIKEYEIVKINFLQDTAELKLFYAE